MQMQVITLWTGTDNMTCILVCNIGILKSDNCTKKFTSIPPPVMSALLITKVSPLEK